jgi:hypothetical protein
LVLLNLQAMNGTGAELTMVAATSGGDLVPNNGGDTILVVNNGGASAITVTAPATKSCSHGFKHDLSESVAAGKTEYIKLYDRLNNNLNQVPISYSSVTSVTVAAMK